MSEHPVIVGLGEILWDVYPQGAHFGGAPANFACHVASLGGEAVMVGAVGRDALGDRALTELQARRVSCRHVLRDPEHATGTVQVRLGAGGQASYEFAADTAWDHLAWSPSFAGLAERCDAVCFGSLGQRWPVARGTIRRFVQATRPGALRVFDVNLRQQFYDRETIAESLELASAVKLNDDELPVIAALCGLSGADEVSLLVALAERFELRLAALTRGSRGSILLRESVIDHCGAPPTTVADTVGAGDSFTAVIVTGHLLGVPLAELNERANAVAAFVCSQPGATPALPDQLAHFSSHQPVILQ